MLDERVTVPENPPKLVRVIVDVPEELRGMLKVVGFAVIEKSGVVPALLKTAVWTVSGTGFRPPFAISAQIVVPETLLEEQPVWKPRGIPEVVAVML